MEIVTGEVININNEYTSYQDYKAAVDAELQKSAESFVKIGYLLKLARDTDILEGSGYTNVIEFAEGEYHLEKSQVSRFININDQFSENGYSATLEEKYRGFGHAKLALMLRLPAALNEELSPSYSKTEIQAIKEEIDAEKEISDIEVMLEGESEAIKDLTGNMAKALHQLFHDQPELFCQIWEIEREAEGTERDPQLILDALAPQGEAIHSVRIQGAGRFMISIKGLENDLKLINIRTEEKESCPWNEVLEMLWMPGEQAESAKECWEGIYGERFPEAEKPQKTEVAPVQPSKKETPPPPRKQSKVTKAKTEKPRQPSAEEPEKPLPGQREIFDYPETIPESMEVPSKPMEATADETAQPAAGTEEISQSAAGTEDIFKPAAGLEEIYQEVANEKPQDTVFTECKAISDNEKLEAEIIDGINVQDKRFIIRHETSREVVTEIMLEIERAHKATGSVITVTIKTEQ